LSTIKVIREGKPRILSPSIFPEPSHLYYNDMVPTQGTSSDPFFSSFTEAYWDTKKSVQIDISQPTNYVRMVSQFDDVLYNDKEKVLNGFFGNYFLYSLNETDPKAKKYAAFSLINATSQDALAAYGAYVN